MRLRTAAATLAIAVTSAAALAVLLGVYGPATSATHRSLAKPKPRFCARVAGPGGQDTNPGTLARPFRTAQHLVERLAPGETGCLRSGAYEGSLRIVRGGVPGKPITVRSMPGGRATVRGLVWVAGTADDVVVSNLTLDGSTTDGAPSPQVNGDRVTFRANDVSNANTAICFVLGGDADAYGAAVQTVIDGNRIHNCGRLPATNHDHGIYVESSRSARIVNNLIYDNADWGIHLYPDADDSYIAWNVIDGNGNGLIFAGATTSKNPPVVLSSDNNLVEFNVISNSTLRYNIETYWSSVVGTGNVARFNCLWNGKFGDTGDMTGVAVGGNRSADPLFADRGSKSFRMDPRGACALLGAGPRQQ
jgi:parallel beta-helix repeat protein